MLRKTTPTKTKYKDLFPSIGTEVRRGKRRVETQREGMAPMKLYDVMMSWDVTRCVAALEEAGSEYEIVPINCSTGEHKSPEHLARNIRYFLPLS
jgi:hypothetical protein